MKVLVVEDSELIQEILSDELTHIDGVELCGRAYNSEDAVRLILGNAPDLIILDIVLHNGNGFEVLKKIRDEGSTSRVMVLSNHTYPYYRQKFKELGAELFFDKSIEFDEAIEAVRVMARNN